MKHRDRQDGRNCLDTLARNDGRGSLAQNRNDGGRIRAHLGADGERSRPSPKDEPPCRQVKETSVVWPAVKVNLPWREDRELRNRRLAGSRCPPAGQQAAFLTPGLQQHQPRARNHASALLAAPTQPVAVPTAAAAAAPSASPLALQLPPRDYESAGGERCADGAHVVLIPVIPMGSIIMRGLMPLSVLNSTRPALHGARVSYLGWTGPRNLTLAQRLDRHFAQFGAPSACVLLKYADDDALSACRRRGALVLLDCIDNFRCFGVSRALHEYPKYDALLVQTAAHQRWLAGKGVRSAVLPHPHGDHRRVRHAHPLRARLRGVGLVYGDPKNLPLRHELVAICRACAAVNATFYLVYSPSSSTLKAPQPYHCEGHGGKPAPPPPRGPPAARVVATTGGAAASAARRRRCRRATPAPRRPPRSAPRIWARCSPPT